MDHRRSVLKQHAVKQPFVETNGQAWRASRPLRIPAAQVEGLPWEGAGDASEEAVPLSAVLRGEERVSRAAPYVMADLRLEPDFPLAAVVPEALGAKEAPPDALEEQEHTLQAERQARLEEAVERAREEAYEAGYEEGYVAAEAALQASFERRKEDLEKDVIRLREAWAAFLKKCEPLMASLAFDVVQQLLDAPLPKDVRAVSTQALSQALDQFGKGTPLEIALHPDDYARLQAYGFIDDLKEAGQDIRWNPQAFIPTGDWVIQSPDAAIRRLKEEMLGHLRSRLGLQASMKSRDL